MLSYLLSIVFLFSVGAETTVSTHHTAANSTGKSSYFKSIPALFTMTCEERSEQYNCNEQISEIGSKNRVLYLNCKNNNERPIVTCGKYVLIGASTGVLTSTASRFAVRKVGAAALGRVLGYVGLATLAYSTVSDSIKEDEKCYNNKQQKRASLQPYFLYHNISRENEAIYMKWSCTEIQKAVGIVTEQIKTSVFNRRLKQKKYDEYISRRPNDPRYLKRANRMYPAEERWPIPENEMAVLRHFSDAKKVEEKFRESMFALAKRYPCANFSKMAQWVCGTISTGAGVALAKRNPWEIANELVVTTTGSAEAMMKKGKFIRSEIKNVFSRPAKRKTEKLGLKARGVTAKMRHMVEDRTSRVMASLEPEIGVDTEGIVNNTLQSAPVATLKAAGIRVKPLPDDVTPVLIKASNTGPVQYMRVFSARPFAEAHRIDDGLAFRHADFTESYRLLNQLHYKVYFSSGNEGQKVQWNRKYNSVVIPTTATWSELNRSLQQILSNEKSI